ncbi:UBCc and E1_enzyme_family domain-containing protein [Ktedonobacteria bacterium brp13]|nr:UBCc and E1_enzyme_family domain-containing protein [Ktedonobacteria bacterium brp13]
MNTKFTDQFDKALHEVEERGIFRVPRRIESSEFANAAVLEGKVSIMDHEVTLWLVLDESFPLMLPRFFLRPWDTLGVIPHVDRRGMVCFADPEGLVMDRYRPVQVVQEALERVVQVLTDGVMGQNRADFADEFEAYWRQRPGIIACDSVLDPADKVTRVIIATDAAKKRIMVAGSENDILAFYNGIEVGGKNTLQKALYIPLEAGIPLILPRHDGPFWSAKEARHTLLAAVSRANKEQLKKMLKRHAHRREYIIVKLPRPSGGATLFGIQYDVVGRHHPLHKDGIATGLMPLHLQRLDRGYLVQRGGGVANLSTKRVLLVGCGAVGGCLAFELARAGILYLTLVDSDKLIPENSFRHVLGRRYWYRRKVEALKEEIESELPYVQVTAISNTIEKVLTEGLIKLSDYDLLVLATGNPTVELEINAQVHTLRGGPPAVFTWLEPLGIGGHALLTHNAPDGGCFECLYTSSEGNEELQGNRAAFAAPGQSFGRALSGCGSLYTPYGAMDAARTASLAVRLVVNTLRGKEPGNPLLSWKGNATDFIAEGFRLSSRFRGTEDDLQHHRYKYSSVQCRICNAQEEKIS